MLVGAKLQDFFGSKRTFLAGAAIYDVGTVTAAISQDAAIFLVGWSILGGIGTVLMLPATVMFISGTCQGKERAFAFGVWSGIAAAASIFGLIFSGYQTLFYSWRWVFALELVVLLIIVALQWLLLETLPMASWKSFDIGWSAPIGPRHHYPGFGFHPSQRAGRMGDRSLRPIIAPSSKPAPVCL